MDSNDFNNLKSKLAHKGRAKGTPNKPKKCVAEICEELGFNPFEFFAHVANGDWEMLGYTSEKTERLTKDGKVIIEDRISLDQRIKAASHLSPHIAPMLKAIEHSGSVEIGVYEKQAQEAREKYLKVKSM